MRIFSIKASVLWESAPGTTIQQAICDVIEVVNLLDRGLSGDYGQLRRCRLIHNNIVLEVGKGDTFESIMAEFTRRMNNGEGLYSSQRLYSSQQVEQ